MEFTDFVALAATHNVISVTRTVLADTLTPVSAYLALRTGAPILPIAVYFEARGQHRAVIQPPVPAERLGRLREDVERVTQDIARRFEDLIRAHPEQWHVMQPNWPSDREDT